MGPASIAGRAVVLKRRTGCFWPQTPAGLLASNAGRAGYAWVGLDGGLKRRPGWVCLGRVGRWPQTPAGLGLPGWGWTVASNAGRAGVAWVGLDGGLKRRPGWVCLGRVGRWPQTPAGLGLPGSGWTVASNAGRAGG